MGGIGIGLGIGLSRGAHSRPPQVTPEVEAAHVAAVERLAAQTGLERFGTVSEADIAGDEVVALLRLPANHRERIIQAGSLPIQLIRALMADPSRLHQISSRKFEEFVAELLASLGFADVLLTASSGDGGKDIIASKVFHGIPLTFYFECKRYAEHRTVDLQTVRALLGTVENRRQERPANIGVLVTTATFEPGARTLFAEEARLDGKDYHDLVGWMPEAWPELAR